MTNDLLKRSMFGPQALGGAEVAPEEAVRASPLHRPAVWVLADHKTGHTAQSVALADALGWPYEIKQLRFNRLQRLSNTLLGASTLSIDRERSAPLVAPWPDLVIATGRAAAPVARWIKVRSGNRTRLVQLGRRGTDRRTDAFDLSVACGFFGLPRHARRIETLAPVAAIAEERLREAAERWKDLFAGMPRPHVALLVGGSSNANLLDEACASRMAREVTAWADAAGGSLYVVTSPRTGGAVVHALRAHLPASARLYDWKRDDPDNPYLGCLALADVLVVTGDSEAMLGEAAATPRPLYVYPVPAIVGASLRKRVRSWVGARAQPDGAWLSRVCAGLLERGVVRPPRDLSAFHRRLFERGYARPFGTPLDARARTPLVELDLIVERVRALPGLAQAGSGERS